MLFIRKSYSRKSFLLRRHKTIPGFSVVLKFFNKQLTMFFKKQSPQALPGPKIFPKKRGSELKSVKTRKILNPYFSAQLGMEECNCKSEFSKTKSRIIILHT